LVESAGLADRVQFVGFLKNSAEVPGWYRALSVVVCASRNEGFGLSCLEGMASGCPVVATRTGAWPELLDDGIDGSLVPCNDAGALADAILRITEDPQRVSRMGAMARDKVVAKYQIRNEADGIYSEYRRLLAKRGISSLKDEYE
jgi:mannosyltransferase